MDSPVLSSAPVLYTNKAEEAPRPWTVWFPTGKYFEAAVPADCVICDQPIPKEGMEEYVSQGVGETPATFSVRRHFVEHALPPMNRLPPMPGGRVANG